MAWNVPFIDNKYLKSSQFQQLQTLVTVLSCFKTRCPTSTPSGPFWITAPSISHSHSSSASPSLASFPFSYKGTQVSHKLKKHSSWQRNPSPITPLLYFPKTQLLKAPSLLTLLFKYLLSTNVSSTQGHSSKQNRLFLNPPSYGLHPAPTSTHQPCCWNCSQ